MCPIETPEGPNIGLIGSLSTYGAHQRVRVHRDAVPRASTAGKVTDEDRLPVGRRGGPARHRPGQRAVSTQDGHVHRALRARAPQGRRGRLRSARRGRLHGRVAEAARLGGRRADPVPGARRREPRPDGRQHAAPGRAAAPLRGPARRHRAWSSARRSTPATWSSPRRPARSSDVSADQIVVKERDGQPARPTS